MKKTELSQMNKEKFVGECVKRAKHYNKKADAAKKPATGLLSFIREDKSVPIRKLAQAYSNLCKEMSSNEIARVLTPLDIIALCAEPNQVSFLKGAHDLLPVNLKSAVQEALDRQQRIDSLHDTLGC